jgi:ribosomal protein S12 methylthiotransferase accessory factor
MEHLAMSWEAGERSISPNKAYQAALEKCSELGIQVNFQKYGAKINSWNCDILKNGNFITNGRGKGIGIQSKTSALFEAIEHFVYENEDHSLLYCSELGSESLDSVLLNGASPDFSLILGGRPSKFSRIPMRSFGSIDRVLYSPAFLFYPNFVSSHKEENEIISHYGLLRYSTNNGTASGIDVAEAGLHALLETVERDAIGIEMLRTVISKEPLPVRQIRLGPVDV